MPPLQIQCAGIAMGLKLVSREDSADDCLIFQTPWFWDYSECWRGYPKQVSRKPHGATNCQTLSQHVRQYFKEATLPRNPGDFMPERTLKYLKRFYFY